MSAVEDHHPNLNKWGNLLTAIYLKQKELKKWLKEWLLEDFGGEAEASGSSIKVFRKIVGLRIMYLRKRSGEWTLYSF